MMTLIYMIIFFIFLPSVIHPNMTEFDLLKLPKKIKIYEAARGLYFLLTLFLIFWHIIF